MTVISIRVVLVTILVVIMVTIQISVANWIRKKRLQERAPAKRSEPDLETRISDPSRLAATHQMRRAPFVPERMVIVMVIVMVTVVVIVILIIYK